MRTLAPVVVGPVLSLTTFFASYCFDVFKLGEQHPSAAIPSFLLSMVVLLVSQVVTIHLEVRKASDGSDRVCEAVKDHIPVIAVGVPEKAWGYVMGQLPRLKCVQNTSFNYERELERTVERLYSSVSYSGSPKEIARHVERGLIWKDLGDLAALDRFRAIADAVGNGSGTGAGGYDYRLIRESPPQLGFMLLTYEDDSDEVLFNWDYLQENMGHEPTVLLSRDECVVGMFAAHFKNLWDGFGAMDYDNTPTRSRS